MRFLDGLRTSAKELFLMENRRGKAPAPGGSSAQLRQAAPQGPFSGWFAGYVPRRVSPEFYEVLRDAVPVVGAAIRRLSALTGTLQVEGDNGKLVDELREFFTFVPVNDFQVGIQAFLDNYQNEAFEQGFALHEEVWDAGMTDIVNLRVGDSKLICFTTDEKGVLGAAARSQAVPVSGANANLFDPSTSVQQMISGAWNALGWFPSGGISDVPLNMANKGYLCFHGNNQDPYGESLMSSMPFVAKLFATVLNQGMNVWERYGDPSYNVKYKTTARSLGPDSADVRRDKIAADFTAAINAKRKGKSGDFVNVVGKDDDMVVEVIGAEGKVMTMEVPYRLCVEQMVSKTGLSPWMLGINLGANNAGGVKEAEVELVLSDAEVRKASLLPILHTMSRRLLAARGRTWKPGDFVLSLKSPNLHDLIATAQAGFLNAQARLMESGAAANGAVIETTPGTGNEPAKTVIRINTKDNSPQPPLRLRGGAEGGGVISLRGKLALYRSKSLNAVQHHCHETKDRSPEAEQIVNDYYTDTAALWADARDKVLNILGLSGYGEDKAALKAFEFTPAQDGQVKKAVMSFAEKMKAHSQEEHGPVVTYTGRAHALGLVQAAQASGLAAPTLDLIKNREVYQELLDSGFKLVTDKATLIYADEIKAAMQSGVERGANPKDVARDLMKVFDDKNPDWERIARSEVALAQETAKINEWDAEGVKKVRFSPASGACTICQALAGDYKIGECPVPMADTHPRCTCAITLAD